MNEIELRVEGAIFRVTNLNNGNKYDRAQKDAGLDATPKQILAHYDKLRGNIQGGNGTYVDNGSFWTEEQARLATEINNVSSKSDDELEIIVRRAENTNVPGSLFNRAKLELELRDRKQPNVQAPRADRWWEKGWVQAIMFVSAIAGLAALLL